MLSNDVIASQHERKGGYEKAANIYYDYAEEEHRYGKSKKNDSAFLFAAESYKAAAFCFKTLKDEGRYVESLKKAVDSYKNYRDLFIPTATPGKAFINNWTDKRIADLHMHLGEVESAKASLRKTIKFVIERIGEFKDGNLLIYAGGFYEMLAMLYQKIGEFKKATECCGKAEEYLSSDSQEANTYIYEPYFNMFALDFVEELVIAGFEKGVFYAEENPDIFAMLKDYKTRIKLRKELIKKAQQNSHS